MATQIQFEPMQGPAVTAAALPVCVACTQRPKCCRPFLKQLQQALLLAARVCKCRCRPLLGVSGMIPENVRIEISEQPLACVFHPTQSLVYSATCEGSVHCHQLPASVAPHSATADAAPERWTCQTSSSKASNACRALCVAEEGRCLIAGTAAGALLIIDAEDGRKRQRLREPSGQPSGQSLHCLCSLNDHCFASGASPHMRCRAQLVHNHTTCAW